MFKVLMQAWTESERGWGMRPDGYTFHLTKEDHAKFVKDNWNWYVSRYGNRTPDEYSFPDGDVVQVTVTKECFEQLLEEDNGLWVSNKRMKECVVVSE